MSNKRKGLSRLSKAALAWTLAGGILPCLPVYGDEAKERKEESGTPAYSSYVMENSPEIRGIPHYLLRPGRSNYSSAFDVYHFTTQNGITTVVLENTSTLHVYELDSSMKMVKDRKINLPLPIFGGLYQSESGDFYAACGQDNPTESSETLVVQIVKYDSSWNHQETASYYGDESNHYPGIKKPFSFSKADMAERDGILYLDFGREMFRQKDGISHQTNMMVALDMESMEPVEITEDLWLEKPYASHSMNQLICSDNGVLITADLCDAYPRGLEINRSDSYRSIVPFSFSGKEGDHWTGASLAGLETGKYANILAGSAAPHAVGINGITDLKGDSSLKHNLYLIQLSKEGVSYTFRWLTNNDPKTSAIDYMSPQLIKVSDDRFILLAPFTDTEVTSFWNDDINWKLHYLCLTSNGTVLKEEVYENLPFSGSHQKALFQDGSLYWLVAPKWDGSGTYPSRYIKLDCPGLEEDSSASGHWVKEDGTWHWQLEDGSYYKAFTSQNVRLLSIEDKTYGFDEQGNMITGLAASEDGDYYYFLKDGTRFQEDVTRKNGSWFHDSKTKSWHYFVDGIMQKNCLADWYDNEGNIQSTHYLDAEGRMKKNVWAYINGKQYYFDQQGIMVKNQWVKINMHWYYFLEDGNLAANQWIEGCFVDQFGKWDMTKTKASLSNNTVGLWRIRGKAI